MKVIVTGAGGFIGRHLVVDQLRRGREVTALDLHVESLLPLSAMPKLRIVEGDFTDAALLETLLSGQDVCFHLASAHLETGVDESHFWRVNVEGTRSFVERCQRAEITRFVHCSSVGVFGDIRQPPANEQSPCFPEIPYEKSKLEGEKAILAYARENNYQLAVLRPAWVYGPGCQRTEKLFRAIKAGRFFFVGNGQQLRHAVYIDDMVRAFDLAAMHDAAINQMFIIAGPRATTLRELVDEIARILNVPSPRVHLPKVLVWSACYILELSFSALNKDAPFTRRSLKFFTGNTAFSTDKAQQVLGFRPEIELREGLQMTYEWIKDGGRRDLIYE